MFMENELQQIISLLNASHTWREIIKRFINFLMMVDESNTSNS